MSDPRSIWAGGPSDELRSSVVRAAIAQGYLGDDSAAVIFHDLDLLDDRIDALTSAFPDTTLHAIAIKANPLVEILKRAVASGAGLEAASMEEVEIARAAGCDPARIVFDSPAKTRSDLRRALDLGVMINVDNVAELRRLDEARRPSDTSLVGIRVNPSVGVGRIAATSVAGSDSKFGLPLERARIELPELLRSRPWLTGIHVHVGSQGCSLDQLTDAAVAVEALRLELNAELGTEQLSVIDLGGGLPTTYSGSDEPIAIETYATKLRAAVPTWFGAGVRLVTEFGRALQANCGWAVSRVEYVKRLGTTDLAVLHVGADLLLRTAYRPEDWPHEFSSLADDGSIPEGDPHRWTIGGPLCFAGDIIGRDVPLVGVRPGSLVAVRDVGAYTLSMWSRHCSRGMPDVLGHTGGLTAPTLSVLRRRETPADIASFWGIDGHQTDAHPPSE